MWLLYPGKGNRAKRKADRQETRSGCLKQPAAKPHQEARVLRPVRIQFARRERIS